MILVYVQGPSTLESKQVTVENAHFLQEAAWIDLLDPTKEEEHLVERYLQFNVPSKSEMQEIELSSRLYRENGALFMTATMIAQSTLNPVSDAITFILTEKCLVTIRYIEPQIFKLFVARLSHLEPQERHPVKLLIILLETATDRLADILENVIQRLDQLSQMIFTSAAHHVTPHLKYPILLQNLGMNDDLGTKARESLMSFNLLASYFGGAAESRLDEDAKSRLKIIIRDIVALSDHAAFISNKTNFLLNATLGFVNIEQNNIIKIFSVAAVIFLPPTLIASIYGMNFQFMPELNWYLGYPLAIGLMVLSALIPFRYFKKHKWL